MLVKFVTILQVILFCICDVRYNWRTFLTGVDILKVKTPWSSLCIVTESAICSPFNALNVFIHSTDKFILFCYIIYIHGSVHRESNLITVQQDATYSVYYISVGGTAVAQWLRCCATNRKVASAIPAGETVRGPR